MALQTNRLADCPTGGGQNKEKDDTEILISFEKARKVKEEERRFVKTYAHVGYIKILLNPKKEKIAVLTKRAREALGLCK